MSNIRDKMAKQVEQINNSISNEEERTKVLHVIQDMLSDFTSYVVHLNEKQNELSEKFDDLSEIVLDLEDEIHESFEDNTVICPYCGEEIPIMYKDTDNTFECPICHNSIIMAYESTEQLEESSKGEISSMSFSKVMNKDNIIDISAYGEMHKKDKGPKKRKK